MPCNRRGKWLILQQSRDGAGVTGLSDWSVAESVDAGRTPAVTAETKDGPVFFLQFDYGKRHRLPVYRYERADRPGDGRDALLAPGHRRPPLSDLASRIEYVVLDSTPSEALVGEVYMLLPSQTGFYITEKNFGAANSGVKYFDRTGQYVSERGRIGHGPGEYPSVSYLTVDYPRDVVYISGTGVVAYDRENRMVARNDSIRSAQIAYYDHALHVLKYPSTEGGPNGLRSLIDRYTSELALSGGLQVADKGTVRVDVGFQAFNGNGHTLLVKEELSDTVCSVAGDSLQPLYRLDLGPYRFPAERLTFEAMNEWNDYYRVFDLLDGERYLFLFVQNGLMGDRRLLVYDKTRQQCYTPQGSDSREGLFLEGVRFTPRSIYRNQLFGEFDLLDLLDHRESITDPALRTIAAGLSEESNLVLGIVTLGH